jgi:hypothetical protein
MKKLKTLCKARKHMDELRDEIVQVVRDRSTSARSVSG